MAYGFPLLLPAGRRASGQLPESRMDYPLHAPGQRGEPRLLSGNWQRRYRRPYHFTRLLCIRLGQLGGVYRRCRGSRWCAEWGDDRRQAARPDDYDLSAR